MTRSNWGDRFTREIEVTAPDYESQREIPESQRHAIEPGDEIGLGDSTVHVRGGNEPNATGGTTFVLERESSAYFNSGDSRSGPLSESVGDRVDVEEPGITPLEALGA